MQEPGKRLGLWFDSSRCRQMGAEIGREEDSEWSSLQAARMVWVAIRAISLNLSFPEKPETHPVEPLKKREEIWAERGIIHAI